jgi:hypothetical protein
MQNLENMGVTGGGASHSGTERLLQLGRCGFATAIAQIRLSKSMIIL